MIGAERGESEHVLGAQQTSAQQLQPARRESSTAMAEQSQRQLALASTQHAEQELHTLDAPSAERVDVLEASLQSHSELLPEALATEAAVGASRAEQSTEERAPLAAESSRQETLASAQHTDTSAQIIQVDASAGEQQTLVEPHLETAAAQDTLLQHADTAARQCLVAESASALVSAGAQCPEMRESRAEVSIAERSTTSVEANALSELHGESEKAATARDASEEVAWQQQQEEAEANFELELDERTQDAVHTEAVAAPTSVESRDFVFTA